MPTHPAPPRRKPPVEVIDPRWLLKAGAIVTGVAAICGYLTFCFLFYQGQWQFALSPGHATGATPASLNLPFEALRIGPDTSGTPQLAAWWVPAEDPAAPTALLLHGGTGTLSDTVSTIAELHAASLNVLAIDYRGFGDSAGKHPTEALMQADATAALTYLTDTRHIPETRITPTGTGLGASLAAGLCSLHRDLRGCIFLDPAGDIDDRIAHDPRTRILPSSLLLNQHFALRKPLQLLPMPKLIVTAMGESPDLARAAASPKLTVEIPSHDAGQTTAAIRRFLSQ